MLVMTRAVALLTCPERGRERLRGTLACRPLAAWSCSELLLHGRLGGGWGLGRRPWDAQARHRTASSARLAPHHGLPSPLASSLRVLPAPHPPAENLGLHCSQHWLVPSLAQAPGPRLKHCTQSRWLLPFTGLFPQTEPSLSLATQGHWGSWLVDSPQSALSAADRMAPTTSVPWVAAEALLVVGTRMVTPPRGGSIPFP